MSDEKHTSASMGVAAAALTSNALAEPLPLLLRRALLLLLLLEALEARTRVKPLLI